MGSRIELHPDALIVFYTVYECKKKQRSNVIIKVNRGNFIGSASANEKKVELEEAMGRGSVWEKDNDGRFYHRTAPDVRWFYVKHRKFRIEK